MSKRSCIIKTYKSYNASAVMTQQSWPHRIFALVFKKDPKHPFESSWTWTCGI